MSRNGLPDPRYDRRQCPRLTVEELRERRAAIPPPDPAQTGSVMVFTIRCEHCGQPYDPFDRHGNPIYQYADCHVCGWPRIHEPFKTECECGWVHPAVRNWRECARRRNQQIMDILTGAE